MEVHPVLRFAKNQVKENKAVKGEIVTKIPPHFKWIVPPTR